MLIELTDPDGNRLVVDQVVIGENTWIQREQTIELLNDLPTLKDIATQLVWIYTHLNQYHFTVPFLQVKQEVMIHLVKSSDLDASGPNPTPPYKTLTIYPVFNVALNAAQLGGAGNGGPLTLSYTLAHVDFGLLILGLSAAQRTEIQQFIAEVKLPSTTVDFGGALTAMLKRPVTAINAGIACDPASLFVALRVDLDLYASPSALGQEFFEAGPTNLLAGKDWAMFIDANVLTQNANENAKKALEDAPRVIPKSGPEASWDSGGPAIDISATIEVEDACPLLGNMDADVDIRVSFSVPQPNTLRTHFHLGAKPSYVVDEIACAMTGAVLWPFLGPQFLQSEKIGTGLGAYFGGLAGGPLVFFGLIAAIESAGLPGDISEELGSTCKKQDDELRVQRRAEPRDDTDPALPLAPRAGDRLGRPERSCYFRHDQKPARFLHGLPF